MKEWIVVLNLADRHRGWVPWHERTPKGIHPMDPDTMEGCIARFTRALKAAPDRQDTYFIINWATGEIISCVAFQL